MASKFLFPLVAVGIVGDLVYLIWFASVAIGRELLFHGCGKSSSWLRHTLYFGCRNR